MKTVISFHGNKSFGIALISVFFVISIFFAGKRAECGYEIKKNEKRYEKLVEENEIDSQQEINGI